MSALPVIKHVGHAWGFEHYEASVRVADEPTVAEIVTAAELATTAARSADGRDIDGARVRPIHGRTFVIVRFSRPDEA